MVLQVAERTAGHIPSLEDFFENGVVGLHIVGGDGTILRANKAELELLGYSADEYVGQKVRDFHADDEAINDILARLGRGETLDKYPARLRAKDGSIRHVQISSSACLDESGRFLNTRCVTVDVTDQQQAQQALSEAEQRLAATYERALAGISEVDRHGRYLRVNPGMVQLVGWPKEKLIGAELFSITFPADVEADRAQFASQVRGDIGEYVIEKRFVREDGSQAWAHVQSSTVKGRDGGFLYAVRVATDITDPKQAEARHQVLVNELNHRVKNTLATVQSFAKQTAPRTRDVDDFMERFEGRLVALSKAHDRLTRRNWEGGSLAEIVREELGLHDGGGRKLKAAGEDVPVSARQSLALSMALHELGTNAIKYGALSRAGGSVAVSWTVERDQQRTPVAAELRWTERNGPTVAPPDRPGFGSRLLEAMAVEMGGESELRFDPEGLSWRLAFPLGASGYSAAAAAA